MRQKHLCRGFHCCRLRIWNTRHICSWLWPKMGEYLVHLREQCLVTAGASGHRWCRLPVTLHPLCHVPHGLLTAGTRGHHHHRLCCSLSSFAWKVARSLIHLAFSWMVGYVTHTLPVGWGSCFPVFCAYGQQLHGWLQRGGVGMGPCGSWWWKGWVQPVGWTFSWGFLPASQPWRRWELPPIWVSLFSRCRWRGLGEFKYSNSMEISQEQKPVCPFLLFSTLEHTKIRKILFSVPTKAVISSALFSGVEESF